MAARSAFVCGIRLQPLTNPTRHISRPRNFTVNMLANNVNKLVHSALASKLWLCVALVAALASVGDAALAVGPHSMKMHLEWNSAVELEDWDDWKLAFDRADRDGDLHISRHDMRKVFVEHFHILHDRMEGHHKVFVHPSGSRASLRFYHVYHVVAPRPPPPSPPSLPALVEHPNRSVTNRLKSTTFFKMQTILSRFGSSALCCPGADPACFWRSSLTSTNRRCLLTWTA
jgi:hypothetical protein